jgi:two-component system, sensor histidine kinase and response regulator
MGHAGGTGEADPRNFFARVLGGWRAIRTRSEVNAFIALIAFDAIAVAASVSLNHAIVQSYEAHNAESARWAELQGNLAAVGRLASDANAPGNDVLVSGDVAAERRRFARTMLHLTSTLAVFEHKALTGPDAAHADETRRLCAAVRDNLLRITDHTEQVFGVLGNGDERAATRAMALLDQAHGELMTRLSDLADALIARRNARIMQDAASLRTTNMFELAVAGLIMAALLATGVYGGLLLRRARRLVVEQQDAAQVAQAASFKLHSILNTAKDGIITINQLGVVQSFNPAAARIFGYRPEEVIGKNISMLMPAPYQHQHDRYLSDYMAGGERKVIGIGRDVSGLRKNGDVFPMELSVTEVTAMGERLFTGFVRDISERKAAEASSRLLSAIVEFSDDAIVSVAIDGTITSWNQGAERLFGFTSLEMIGRPSAELIPEEREGERAGLMGRVERGETVLNFETQRRHKNGNLIDIAATISPIRDASGAVIGASKVVRDITAQKRSEQTIARYTMELELKSHALEEAKEAAEHAARQKSEFLANMSHEIRTPMNGIVGMNNLLMDTALNDQQKHYCNAALKSAEGLLQIINDVLDFSKIEAGKIALEPLPFDLLLLVEEAVDLVAMRAAEKQVDIVVKFAPDAPRRVIGDAGRVRQIVLNLLSNAVKFTERGYVCIDVRGGCDASGRAAIRMVVEDTGIGMAKEAAAQIFEKFSQADSSITRRFGGTGLGLSICQKLVDLMGGAIGVESTLGVGSAFYISLALGAEQQAESRAVDPEALAGRRILLIERIGARMSAYKEALEAAGARVDATLDAAGGLELARRRIGESQGFDMIFADVDLAADNRESVLAMLAREHAELGAPVIALGSAHKRAPVAAVKRLGVKGLLNAPFAAIRLVEAAVKVMAAREQGGADEVFVTRHLLRDTMDHVVDGGDAPLFRNVHVLLAEDNSVNLEVATIMIERLGCRVTPAGNGSEAVRQFMQQSFDLILMDCQMPVLDGFAATAKIRQIELERNLPATPIIAFTANAMRGDADLCLQAGMNDHIAKPAGRNALRSTLLKWAPPEKQTQNTGAPVARGPAAELVPTDFDGAVFDALAAMMRAKLPALLDRYLRDGHTYLERASAAIGAGDRAALAAAVHPLRSSSANLGAQGVARLAGEIETKALAGEKVGEIADLIARLAAAFAAARAAIEHRRQALSLDAA